MNPVRSFLRCLLLAGVVSMAAAAAAEPVTVARLRYEGGDWYCDPGSLSNWLREVRERTGVPTAIDPVVVGMDSEDLYRHPLIYLSGHGRIDMTDAEVAELRRWLDAGGFLWADDNYGLDASFRALMERVYPDEPLVRLGSEHPIYHAYFDLPGLPKIHGHDGDPAQGCGIVRDGRLTVFYSWSADIGDGLEDPEVHGDPPSVREAAARMAVNVMMYALTRP